VPGMVIPGVPLFFLENLLAVDVDIGEAAESLAELLPADPYVFLRCWSTPLNKSC